MTTRSNSEVLFGIKIPKNGASRSARLMARDVSADERRICDVAIRELGARKFVDAVLEVRSPEFALEVIRRGLSITRVQRKKLKSIIPETRLPYVARSALLMIGDFSDEERGRLQKLIAEAHSFAQSVQQAFARVSVN